MAHAIEVVYLPTFSLDTLQVYRVTIHGRLQPFYAVGRCPDAVHV